MVQGLMILEISYYTAVEKAHHQDASLAVGLAPCFGCLDSPALACLWACASGCLIFDIAAAVSCAIYALVACYL